MKEQTNAALGKCRFWLALFIGGLLLSGVTAIPLQWELDVLASWFGVLDPDAVPQSALAEWISRVRSGLSDSYGKYPFIAYGTDWLAFGHIMIALAMYGAYRDPVKNQWLFTFGKLACVLVIPWAIIFGQLRGIPFAWRLIDCAFGVFGLIPLILAERWADKIPGHR